MKSHVYTKILMFFSILFITICLFGVSSSTLEKVYADLPERTESPGPFLVWPLPGYGLDRITRLPDTKWTHHFLGIVDCPPYPALINGGYWSSNVPPGNYPGNRHLIQSGTSDQRVRWNNTDNRFACYGAYPPYLNYDHEGTDISVPGGTAIYAAATGTITHVESHIIRIKHVNVNNSGQTWYTIYRHVDVDPAVAVGMTVVAGTTKIGTISYTDLHLHFETALQPYGSPYIRNPWGVDAYPWNGCLWVNTAICNAVSIYNETLPDNGGGVQTGHFPDVPLTNAFFPFIETLHYLGIVSGFSDGTYRPDNLIARGEMAKVVIEAINESQTYNDGQCAFIDVCPGHPFYHYIRRLKELGITSGYSDGTYRPDNPLTRAEIAKFIVKARLEGEPSYPCNPHFPDVPCSNVFYNYIERLYEIFTLKGFSLGYSDGTYRPDEYITRGGIAKLVVVGLDLESYIPTFYDVLHDNPFIEYIDVIVERNITNGCQTSPYPAYCPTDSLTRGQAAKFIIRGLGEEPYYSDGRQTFPDVPSAPPHTFYHYIERLYELGIASGFSDGTYRPDNSITRAELAKLIVNALGEARVYNDGLQIFSDVPINHVHYHFTRRLYELGITSGYSDGTFRPDISINREQAAKFVALAFVNQIPNVAQEATEGINNGWPTAPTYTNLTRQVIPGTDVDYIRFVVPTTFGLAPSSNNSYRIALNNTGFNADIKVDIYASDGSTLLHSFIGSGEQGSFFSYWTPPSSGTYYVRLSNTNTYALDGAYMDFAADPLVTYPTYLPLTLMRGN